MLSLQEASTLFWYFLWAACVPSVSENEIQSPEAVSMSESSTLPLDDSELEEARSLVLFRLPAAVPPTRPMVALEQLKELAGSHPPCSELGLGPIFRTNSDVSWLPQVELGSNPTSTSGSRQRSSWCDDVQVNYWESGLTFFVRGWPGSQKKGAPPREYIPRECLVGKTLVEVEFLVKELDHQELVSHRAQAQA